MCTNNGKIPNSIYLDDMQKRIETTEFTRIGKKTTICCITMKNGFEVIGISACVDPKNFNELLGQKYSYDEAINKLYELEGYLLQNELYLQNKISEVKDNEL